jgi:hypothetical protein
MDVCFSTGKTAGANLLVGRLRDEFLLDREAIGDVLRDHRLVSPSACSGDFHDLGPWRAFTRDAAMDAAERS